MSRLTNIRVSKKLVTGTVAATLLGAAVFTYAHVNGWLTVKDTRASHFQYTCNAKNPESLPCLEQHYQVITQSLGAATAFTKLKAAYNIDPAARAYCHQLTHVIGRTEANMVQNIDTAYIQGDNFCWSGYYHGVMEAVVTKVGAKNLPAKLPTLCASIKAQKPYSFYHYNCVHGLGHGIMDVNGSKLFVSLDACTLLSDDWERQSCYGGVFMENEMDEVNPDHSTAYLKKSDPMYPCTAVGAIYKYQCYLMQTSHALRLVNYNFSEVFNECSTIEAGYVDTCFQSLGRDASGNSSSSIVQTKTACMLGPTYDAQMNCVIGAVKDFISYYHSDQQADNLCSALDASLQLTCQTTKTQYYRTF